MDDTPLTLALAGFRSLFPPPPCPLLWFGRGTLCSFLSFFLSHMRCAARQEGYVSRGSLASVGPCMPNIIDLLIYHLVCVLWYYDMSDGIHLPDAPASQGILEPQPSL